MAVAAVVLVAAAVCGGGSGAPPMIITPSSRSFVAWRSSTMSDMVILLAGTGFLFWRTFILSSLTTEGPPKYDWICSFSDAIVAVGAVPGRVRVMLGFREDFKVILTVLVVAVAGSAPGAMVGASSDRGGSGCGGWESLGRTYCKDQSAQDTTDDYQEQYGIS